MYSKYGKEAWEKRTIIKDMVHGYIEIPKPIMKEIIDTEQFQRLKDIEQTGMEALYPSATHKRFTHSLGVYYLSRKAFAEFKNNIAVSYPDIYVGVATNKIGNHEEVWARWGLLFQLASLLHDSGHSPFSHTLEFVYDLPERKDKSGIKELDYLLLDGMPDSFRKDFYKEGKSCGKPHERMSALYIKTSEYEGFRNKVEILLGSYLEAYKYCNIYLKDARAMDDDIEFMIRMIIGCHYSYQERDSYSMKGNYSEVQKWYIELQLRNCIISMLNSKLDVDNLDYVVRDSKFSGYASHAVDMERLLSSFTIVQALEFDNLKVTKEDAFDYCLNLKEFTGTLFEGRISGACHIYCPNRNFKVHGRIALEQQEEESDATKRIYQTTDDFSAEVVFNGDNVDKAIITAPKNSKQKYAYIHFKGNMEGTLKGTIFVNNFKQKGLNKAWLTQGRKRIYFAYEQKCMSVLMNAVYNSNFEKKWIYSHHISTFTNDFLYIYLFDKYAEYILEKKATKFFEKLKSVFEIVKFEKLGSKVAEKKDFDELERIKSSIQEERDDANIYKILEQKKDAELIQNYSLMRELIYICSNLKTKKNLEETLEDVIKQLYCIIDECCLNGQKLITSIFDKYYEIWKEYENLKMGEAQIYADLMAMFGAFKLEDIIFYKTSDRDLLAAYKKLYTQIIHKQCSYDYSEFKESYTELAERRYLKCFWKSHPEFEYYFSDWTENERIKLKKFLNGNNGPDNLAYLVLSDNISDLPEEKEAFWNYLKEKYHFTRFVCVPQQIRTKKFIDYETYMKRNDRVLRLKDVRLFNDDFKNYDFMYFYYSQEDDTSIDIFEILSWLKQKIGEMKSGN